MSNLIPPGQGIFGDKSDGDAVFDGTNPVVGFTGPTAAHIYTATRDVFFDNVLINGGVGAITVQMVGFRLFAFTSLTIEPTHTLSDDGAIGGQTKNDGFAAQPGTVGGGGDGGRRVTGANTNGNAGQNVFGALGGVGGKGGDSNAGIALLIGGPAGTVTAPDVKSSVPRFVPASILAQALGAGGTQFVSGGSGGGGGATSGTTSIGATGGGGGGVLVIAARFIRNSGAIHARGGDGGAGFGGDNNGSGGGGGGGGLVLISSNSVPVAGVDANGGAGGLGANVGSNPGLAGSVGLVIQVPTT